MLLIPGQFLAQQFELFFLFRQTQFIRHFSAATFAAQTLASLRQGSQRPLCVRLIRQFDFQLLLAISGTRLEPLQFFLRLRMILFHLWCQIHLRMQAFFRLFDPQLRQLLRFFPVRPVRRQGLGRLRPLRQLIFQLHQTRFQLAARFTPMADFRFQTGHFGVGGVHVALCRMQRIAGSKMGFAQRFCPRFGFAQGGALGFEIGTRPLHFQRQPLAFAGRLALLQQPEQLLFLHQLFVQRLITARHLGLTLQAFDLVPEFLADVLHTQQVFARVFQSPLGFLAPLLVAGDTGGFFEEDAQIVRLGLDDARNHALADDGVGARPQPGAEEEIGDVLAPDLEVVDEVIRLALPRQHPFDRQFGILRPLAHGPAERVVEDQLDRGARHRLAVGRAVEDDIHHRLAAQLRGFRFAQYPAHRIHDVRLAAAVRPDHAHQLPGQGHGRRIDEGFETGKFEFRQAHAREGIRSTPTSWDKPRKPRVEGD